MCTLCNHVPPRPPAEGDEGEEGNWVGRKKREGGEEFAHKNTKLYDGGGGREGGGGGACCTKGSS